MPVGATIAGVSAATNIYAAHKSASASKAAAKTQAGAAKDAETQTRADTDKALSYIMGQQGAVRSPMQTSPAYARMYQGLGLGRPFQQQYGGGGSPIAQGGMVQLQAPDGSTRGVHPSEVDHYVSLGAKRV
jgi:hypothetical protein